MIKQILLAVTIAGFAATPAAAQNKQFTGGDKIPAGHKPPPGMCRIWLDGVPPGQQPAPTDCATAVRNRPANGRVIFGDDYDPKKNKEQGDDRRGVQADANNQNDDRDQDAKDERRGRDSQGVQTITSSQPLPDMMGAVLYSQGRRPPDVRRWLGTSNYTPRFTARAAGRAPDRVTWVDSNGQVMQVWIDSNDDGQADIVELYQRGKLVTRYRP
jgi:hypothetical protein